MDKQSKRVKTVEAVLGMLQAWAKCPALENDGPVILRLVWSPQWFANLCQGWLNQNEHIEDLERRCENQRQIIQLEGLTKEVSDADAD